MLPMVYMALVDDEDLPAFEEIYNKYHKSVYKVAFAILKNEQDAEDAVQETFMKIADSLKNLIQIPCNEMPSYIVIICRNTSLNLYKQKRKRSERNVRFDEWITAEDIISVCDDKAALKQALQKLPQEYKDVIYLFDLMEFSAKETAEQLGMTEVNVRQMAFRARKILKDILTGGDNND